MRLETSAKQEYNSYRLVILQPDSLEKYGGPLSSISKAPEVHFCGRGPIPRIGMQNGYGHKVAQRWLFSGSVIYIQVSTTSTGHIFTLKMEHMDSCGANCVLRKSSCQYDSHAYAPDYFLESKNQTEQTMLMCDPDQVTM